MMVDSGALPSMAMFVSLLILASTCFDPAHSFQYHRTSSFAFSSRVASRRPWSVKTPASLLFRQTHATGGIFPYPSWKRSLANPQDDGPDDQNEHVSKEEENQDATSSDGIFMSDLEDDETSGDVYDGFDSWNWDETDEPPRTRKRDMLKEWFATNYSNMVQPTRMERGDFNDNAETPKTVQTNLDNLFRGMPLINEILGNSKTEPDQATNVEPVQDDKKESSGDGFSSNKAAHKVNETWFDTKRKEIEEKYEEIWNVVRAEIETFRRDDPKGVPETSESVLEGIWRQEMMDEIAETRDGMARDNLAAYEAVQRRYVDSRNVSEIEVDDFLKEMIEDARLEEEQRARAQGKVDDYMKYQEEAFRREADMPMMESQIGDDPDQWALDRLEEMLSARNGDVDFVGDNLEENINELRTRISNEKGRIGSFKPETLKEWQMYRSIATRLQRNETRSEENNGGSTDLKENEDTIATQLQSWKDYQVKEASIRRQSGLARGPRMPFEWQEPGSNSRADVIDSSVPVEADNRSRAEIRADVNRKAVEAFEDLVQSRRGTIRSESLERALEELKTSLEAQNFTDVEEEEVEKKSTGPIDMSDVFTSRISPKQRELRKSRQRINKQDVPSSPDSFASNSNDNVADYSQTEPPSTPDSTPEYPNIAVENPPPLPNTPFFESETDELLEPGIVDSSKLGTLEEQKLRRMYRRAGARTSEEQEILRSQWEAFQKIEKQNRDVAGLSDREYSDPGIDSKLKFNSSELLLDNGDIDAEKILSKIGPRPKRAKGSKDSAGRVVSKSTLSSQAPTVIDNGGEGFSSGEPVDDSTFATKSSDQKVVDRSELHDDEISDQLDGSVSAVGGGRTKDDPQARAQEMAAFKDYKRKGEELRETLDDIDIGLSNGTLSPLNEANVSADEVEYANKVLASIAPRPKVKPKRQRIDIERELSDGSSKDTDSEDEGGDSQIDTDKTTKSMNDDLLLPQWFRKDGAGSKRKSASSLGGSSGVTQSGADDDRKRQNLQQRKQSRAAKRPKQMGIDISDVLGQETYDNDDSRDYQYDDYYGNGGTQGPGLLSYESRKANLLAYTELNILELNALMAHKDSVQTTGVSQYIRRINKPFKDFGAIFRLEGVLLDTTGMEFEAWKKVAEVHGFASPMLDDVRLAIVSRADIAVRKIFFWTDDFILCQRAATTHRIAFKEIFEKWMKDNGLSHHAPDSVSNSPMTNNKSSPSVAESFLGISAGPAPGSQEASRKEINAHEQEEGPTKEEILEMHLYAWTTASAKHGYSDPSPGKVLVAVNLTAEEAFESVFGWTKDYEAIRAVASTFKAELQKLSKRIRKKYNLKPEVVTTKMSLQSSKKKRKIPSYGELFRACLDAWKKVAKKRGFTPPSEELVHRTMAVGPADALPSFQWTADPMESKDIVSSFLSAMKHSSLRRSIGSKFGRASKAKAKAVEDLPLITVVPGAAKWLQSLQDVEMPCATVSFLDGDQVDVLLEYAGLDKFIPKDKRVSARNGYNREGQQLLGAALRLERRPDHCVLFDTTPGSPVAAHDVEMKCVAMIGIHPKYDLLNADSTARYLEELTAMNIRRLFGERVYDQPMIEMENDKPDRQNRKVKTKFWEEGDRQ